MLRYIKEFFRCKFYDGVEVGGSFTFYSNGVVGDIYHIITLGETTVTYQLTWYGYRTGSPQTVTKSDFKTLVSGGEYHGKDYLYSLRWEGC